MTGLTGNTDYDVYIAAEDDAGNLQASAVMVDIKTLAILSSAKDIIDFEILGAHGAVGVNTVTLALLEGTDVTNLTPAYHGIPRSEYQPGKRGRPGFYRPGYLYGDCRRFQYESLYRYREHRSRVPP